MKKINSALTFYALTMCNKVYAETVSDDFGNPKNINDVTEILKPLVTDYVSVISSILVFVAIMCIGISLIINRNKPEERTNLASAIFAVGIGALIIALAGVIYELYKIQ